MNLVSNFVLVCYCLYSIYCDIEKPNLIEALLAASCMNLFPLLSANALSCPYTPKKSDLLFANSFSLALYVGLRFYPKISF